MDKTEIWDAMADHRVCMFIDSDAGRLRARPMAPVVRREDDAVWFVTDARDAKDDEIRANPQVCLAFSDSGDRTFISVSGPAEEVNDVAKLRQIWNPAMEAFFPNGPTDPNVLLLRVRPEIAEYWDGDGKLTAGFKMAAAILGERRAELGDNAKVRM